MSDEALDMSETIATQVRAATSGGPGNPIYAEQRLFIRSPLGTLGTSLLIFFVLVGAYVAIALATQGPIIAFHQGQLVIPKATRAAFTLSLLITTALGMQRFARVREQEDVTRNASAFRRASAAEEYARFTPPGARLAWATIAGLAVGITVSLALNDHAPLARFWQSPAIFYWFSFSTILLCLLFFRGVELTRAGARATKEHIEKELVIDLLRIDRLSICGRSAARSALIWFAVSAVSCLFFVGGMAIAFVIALLFGCLAMGIGIFVLTMEGVHRRIRRAKTEELDHIRNRIDVLRNEAHTSSDAALKLQGLIAYEARIASVPEWPFDQTTAMRMGASAFILTIPWFGQALAGAVVEHLGSVVR